MFGGRHKAFRKAAMCARRPRRRPPLTAVAERRCATCRPSSGAGEHRGSRDGKEGAWRAGKREQVDERSNEPWVEEDDAAKGSCGGVLATVIGSLQLQVDSLSLFLCLLLCGDSQLGAWPMA